MDLGFAGAATVVVGGGRGMGFATAQCLAEDGARIAIVGRSKDVLDAAATQLSRLGSPEAVAIVADTTDSGQVERAFGEVDERWGEINALINTVGPGAAGNFEELTDDQWQQAFDAGLMGMVRCVRAAIPLLRKAEWGRIVNFSAHSTQRQSTRLPAYTAAKSAVNSVSKNLSLLLATDEIMVNVVSPGSISSEALQDWADTVGVDGNDPYALMAAIDEHFGHPAHLPRAGLPSEIGPVAAFLASKRNSYMTGANVNVDGGSDFI
ncbi:SDR family oxidoreductase [Mycobacterium sp. TNTM28]|uniref:3-oxoacyl-[acyl-carrier-protein] reductase MabA n=1 Tax=[Mycobacterium] fortunisiensis TaxID=2600579 RepID=A0ABS6KL16_9MYCO|nr:SDR family oxidoreductase [[Mycobacterium] fortunisiensis]MBU9764295.1 SDR family oxidoreductase [[Mycobacterium] fortunisiensis]